MHQIKTKIMDLFSQKLILQSNNYHIIMNKNHILGLVLIALTAGAFLLTLEDKNSEFEDWKMRFGIQKWTQSEEHYRRLIFYKNLDIINKHNSEPHHTYKMGVNQFTIYTDEEFESLYLNPMMQTNPNADVSMTKEVGADIDWVAKGMVTRVKNQGQCGSCWAFSAIATVESFYKLKNQTVDLSEQQLVDCSASYGNHGCDGGSHVEGTKYVRDKGVTTESDYPYVGKTQACKKQGGTHKVTSVSQTKGCTGMQNALMNRPLGVGVDARGWGKYSSGVFSDCSTDLNHALLLVGVTGTYWHIKNSWGTSWGEHGYIRLALGNTCGICLSDASWAL